MKAVGIFGRKCLKSEELTCCEVREDVDGLLRGLDAVLQLVEGLPGDAEAVQDLPSEVQALEGLLQAWEAADRCGGVVPVEPEVLRGHGDRHDDCEALDDLEERPKIRCGLD